MMTCEAIFVSGQGSVLVQSIIGLLLVCTRSQVQVQFFFAYSFVMCLFVFGFFFTVTPGSVGIPRFGTALPISAFT